MGSMMRDHSWVKVSNTYGADYSGDFRARSKREARSEIDSYAEDIAQDQAARVRLSYALISSTAR